MLEFFRRHRGAFLISLTVIIILSFTVWGGWKKSGMAGAPSGSDRAATIYGKDFTHSELARLDRFRSLYYQLGGFNTFMESMGIEQLAEETAPVEVRKRPTTQGTHAEAPVDGW